MSVKVTVTGSQLAVALMSERQREELPHHHRNLNLPPLEEVAKELQRIEDEYWETAQDDAVVVEASDDTTA